MNSPFTKHICIVGPVIHVPRGSSQKDIDNARSIAEMFSASQPIRQEECTFCKALTPAQIASGCYIHYQPGRIVYT